VQFGTIFPPTFTTQQAAQPDAPVKDRGSSMNRCPTLLVSQEECHHSAEGSKQH